MIGKETMKGAIQLNDFLDSVFGVMKKLLGAAAALGAVAAATLFPVLPLVSKRPAEFAITAILVFTSGVLFGAGITLVTTKGRTKIQIEALDRTIADLSRRPTQEELDAKSAECADLEDLVAELGKRPTQDELDAKIDEIASLKSPVKRAGNNILSLPENELAMVGTLARGSMKTREYVEIFAHLEMLGIAEKLKAPGVLTPTWGLTESAMNALREDAGLAQSVVKAAENGVRDLEAEEYISSSIIRLPQDQLGVVYLMYEKGSFDYTTSNNDPWTYGANQGEAALGELESLGIAKYKTLGNGMRRWTLTDNAARAIADDPGLVAEGKRYFESVNQGDEQ